MRKLGTVHVQGVRNIGMMLALMLASPGVVSACDAPESAMHLSMDRGSLPEPRVAVRERGASAVIVVPQSNRQAPAPQTSPRRGRRILRKVTAALTTATLGLAGAALATQNKAVGKAALITFEAGIAGTIVGIAMEP